MPKEKSDYFIAAMKPGKAGGAKEVTKTLDIIERQRVLRLVVKEILVDDKNIKIKHSIPLLPSNKTGDPNSQSGMPSYLLRSGRPIALTFKRRVRRVG